MTETRVLFIGGWGHHLLRELVDGGAAPIAATACGDGFDDMAHLIAQQSESITWFDDPDRALAEVQPDVVSVGAVYGRIGSWVERALAAGAAVVADKPIAVDDAQLERIRTAVADRPAARLVTELPARADAAFCTARRIVADERIGEPVLATAQKSYTFGQRPDWYSDPGLYPGIEMWVATHAFDFTEFVTGQALAPMAGRSGDVSSRMARVDDHAATLCALAGGGTAVVHADYLRPDRATGHGDDRLRVAGTAGVVEVRDRRCWLLTEGDAEDVTDASLGRDPGHHVWQVLYGDDDVTARSIDLAATVLAARALSR